MEGKFGTCRYEGDVYEVTQFAVASDPSGSDIAEIDTSLTLKPLKTRKPMELMGLQL
jgi:hypothetical protein